MNGNKCFLIFSEGIRTNKIFVIFVFYRESLRASDFIKEYRNKTMPTISNGHIQRLIVVKNLFAFIFY